MPGARRCLGIGDRRVSVVPVFWGSRCRCPMVPMPVEVPVVPVPVGVRLAPIKGASFRESEEFVCWY